MSSGAPILTYRFDGTIWSYKNPNEVFFVSLPTEMSAAYGRAMEPIDPLLDDSYGVPPPAGGPADRGGRP